MNAEGFLARLSEVRRNRNGWMALCPAHRDKNPSLSVGEKKGQVLLHCFAGCTIEAICDALRIKTSDLFSDQCATHKPDPHIVREARRQLTGLRSRLTPRDRERAVTIVLANETNLGAAISRALALAVEGELVQVAHDLEGQ